LRFGLSANYVQKLLSESGTTLTARVPELLAVELCHAGGPT
jgi:hypothetical protein